MSDEKLTSEEIAFTKSQYADQMALKRTGARLQKYVIWVGSIVAGYILLGESLPELIKKWLG